jgi:hypothetical protein
MILPNLVEELSKELKAKVDEVVELTESREDIDIHLEKAKKDVRKIQIALEALTGNDIPIPRIQDEGDSSPAQVPAPSPGVHGVQVPVEQRTPQPAPASLGQVCGACNGQMYYTSKALNNGRVVNMWVCGECRNEKP